MAAIAGKKSVVLIEQPDAGRFGSRRLREHLPRLRLLPRILIRRGSVTSRTLSSTASSSCSRGCWKRRLSAQRWRRSARRFSASARLMSASRSLAKASRGAAIFSSACSADFDRLQRRLYGPRCRDLLAVFSSERGLRFGADIIGWTAQLRRTACGRAPFAAVAAVAAVPARSGVRRRPHATPAPPVPSRRVSVPPTSCVPAWRPPAWAGCNVRSQIATAKTSADRHDHGSHACKISRRYPHVSAPSSTRATRGMGRCSGTAW